MSALDKIAEVCQASYDREQQAQAATAKSLAEKRATEAEEALAAARITLDELNNPRPPAFVIDKLFVRQEVSLLVAESGVGKSTLALRILVGLALGRPALAARHRVSGSGRVAYITSEDRRGQIVYRLSKLAEAEELTDDERAQLVERVAVFDVTETESTALTDFEPKTARRYVSAFAEQIEAWLTAGRFDLVFIDPFGMFIGGSENSNDDVMPIMRWLRGLARRLDSAVVLIHHTGKAAASDGASNQHVGRGASAMNSNARWMGHLAPLRTTSTTFAEQTFVVPPEVGEGEMLVLKNHKATHLAAGDPPILLRRRGWKFDAFDMLPQDSAGARAAQSGADDDVLADWIARMASPTTSLSKADAETRRGEFGLSRDRTAAAWDRLAAAGRLQLERLQAPATAASRRAASASSGPRRSTMSHSDGLHVWGDFARISLGYRNRVMSRAHRSEGGEALRPLCRYRSPGTSSIDRGIEIGGWPSVTLPARTHRASPRHRTPDRWPHRPGEGGLRIFPTRPGGNRASHRLSTPSPDFAARFHPPHARH